MRGINENAKKQSSLDSKPVLQKKSGQKKKKKCLPLASKVNALQKENVVESKWGYILQCYNIHYKKGK